MQISYAQQIQTISLNDFSHQSYGVSDTTFSHPSSPNFSYYLQLAPMY